MHEQNKRKHDELSDLSDHDETSDLYAINPPLEDCWIDMDGLSVLLKNDSPELQKDCAKVVPELRQTDEEPPRRTGRLQENVKIERFKKPAPSQSSDGTLHFKDFPEFRPNLSPKDILQRGSFGGTCFQPLISTVTGQSYDKAWEEFPSDWFTGLTLGVHYGSSTSNDDINTYKVICASKLKDWEENGWVSTVDPYGWFQWYCRFYLGRRCSDDHRQISRALNIIGPSGRWRRNLINKCISSGKPFEEAVDDPTISPKIRQLLQVLSLPFLPFYF
jgi:hypothetical protein